MSFLHTLPISRGVLPYLGCNAWDLKPREPISFLLPRQD